MKMTIRILVVLNVLVLIGLASIVKAEVYVDVGIGLSDGYSYDSGSVSQCRFNPDGTEFGCGNFDLHSSSRNGVLGLVEIGYEINGYSLFFMHLSGISDNDGTGLNMLGIKHKFTLK